ncbi:MULTISPECIES: ribonuclease D [unclassified Prochlorococcus]|uniref:ribonuclease D n=1 Tax=unclassified Prochlorococcus TaxID=2627481 RepID=UPI0005337FB2|nr:MULTISPECIES: ribonuclease D [unclassified Prochlorococcus]KGG14649.1 Ribonuclease D related protein [Prochlorococcus sp. MIT 0602]KGG15921.1 Ribonuclease D related protein [Prochlorococcus sp. MIT 0603]
MTSFAKKPASFKVFEQDLDDAIATKFSKKAILAIDSEAMGLVHGRDRICLVQICDDDDNVACIKIHQGQENAPRLKMLMENNDIEKVFHFARFDVAALASNLKIAVKPIFCTKIASKLGRTYSPRHGLKEVILELVGVELDKHAQSSDWGRIEDLSEKQLEYAANDVRFLIPARNKLKKMLVREQRWELAKKCFECIPTICELDRRRFNNIFEH